MAANLSPHSGQVSKSAKSKNDMYHPNLPTILFFALLLSCAAWVPPSSPLIRSPLSIQTKAASKAASPTRVDRGLHLILKVSETESASEPTLDEVEALNFKGKGTKRGKSKKGEAKDEKPAR